MGLPQMGTVWDQIPGNAHILLLLDHLPDDRFVIKCLLTAGLAALEQAVIALRIEQPLFIKTGFLKLMVHVGGQYEIILASDQRQ